MQLHPSPSSLRWVSGGLAVSWSTALPAAASAPAATGDAIAMAMVLGPSGNLEQKSLGKAPR